MSRILLFTSLVLLLLAGCGDRTLTIDNPDPYDGNAPSAVTLFSPMDNYTSTNRQPVFSWGALTSYSYRLQIATNSNFAFTEYDESFTASSGTNWSPPADLSTTRDLYWRVIATSGSKSNCSPVYTVKPPLAARAVIISEVLWAGVQKDTYSYNYGDFVELYNSSDFAIKIGGFTLTSITSNGEFTNTYELPPGVQLAPGAFYVIGQDCSRHSTDTFLVAFNASAFTYWRPRVEETDSLFGGIYNKEDRDPQFMLILRDSEEREIDSVNAAPGIGGFTAPGNASSPKASMERYIPATDGNLVGSWATATSNINVTTDYTNKTLATPGAANSVWP